MLAVTISCSRADIPSQPGLERPKVLSQGVTEANYRAFMGTCSCLADLAEMSVQQLTPLAGSVLFAKKLHDFLHAPCPVADA